MKSTSLFLEVLSIAMPALVAATAQLPYRWYYFVLTGAVLAGLPSAYHHVMSHADGPTGVGTMMAAASVVLLMPAMHGMKLLIWVLRAEMNHGRPQTGVQLVVGTVFLAAVVTACVWPAALMFVPGMVLPALIQVTVQLPYGKRFLRMNVPVVALGSIALAALWGAVASVRPSCSDTFFSWRCATSGHTR